MKLHPELSLVSLNVTCHIPSTPCAQLYILTLKTILILSCHDLDFCPCTQLWYNCPIIYPVSCSGLAISFLPHGGMTFPPELEKHESLPLLHNNFKNYA